MKSLIHLFNEIGMLAQTPRSGYEFLGAGKQSVAEHSHRMALVAYALAKESNEPVDIAKLLLMCLLHDLPEARTGDLNYVNKRYVEVDENKILDELRSKNSLGEEMASYILEFNENESIESKLSHEADKLEMLLKLKELHDVGSTRAMEWYEIVAKRLKTTSGKEFSEKILTTNSDEWWTIGRSESND